MANSTNHSPLLLSLSLYLLFLLSNGSTVHSLNGKKVLLLQKFIFGDATHKPNCLPQKSKRQKDALIFEIKHHSSCSRPVKNWDEKVQQLLIWDEFRVKLLQSRMKSAYSGSVNDLAEARIPLNSGIKLQTLNYILTIELGGKNMTVIMDTGSDLTWVQCQPCKYCYTQQDPMFNPSLSPTFKSVLCNSSACWSLQFGTGLSGVCGASDQTCNYVVNYGDGSYTRGELGIEQLTVGATKIQGFTFGCGRINHGLFGGASGLMGLGKGPLSLVSQTLANFGGVFSYCLPSTEEDLSGSLILGSDASVYRNSTEITYTRMISNPQMPTFYFLNFTGVNVGGVSIQASGYMTGRSLIDSGTVITRLVPSLYKALKDEFLKQFSGYPSAPAFSILDTCFNLSGYTEVEFPTLKLNFEGGVEVEIDSSGVFYFVRRDGSHVCLALASLSDEDEVGIIGNYQQKNLRVVYDCKESKLGFAEETCSYM